MRLETSSRASRGDRTHPHADRQNEDGGTARGSGGARNGGTHPVVHAHIRTGASRRSRRGRDVLPSGNDQHSIEDDVPDHERQRDPERERYAYCRPGPHTSIIATAQTYDHHEDTKATKPHTASPDGVFFVCFVTSWFKTTYLLADNDSACSTSLTCSRTHAVSASVIT